jgi:transcriptional regulator with XRE-family HTH domain
MRFPRLTKMLRVEEHGGMNKKQPHPIDIHVGERIRLRRIAQGMSQGRLGEQVGVTFQQIQKYEKGVNRIGSSRLLQTARILQVSPDWFYEDAPGDIGDGIASASVESGMFDLLKSREGMALARAFLAIESPKIRRRIVALAQCIARTDEDLDVPQAR